LTATLDLRLPEPERRRAAALATTCRDLLYVPGPGFSSSLDPGLYRSTFVIVPTDAPAIRVSSFVVPAFGGELCRLRLEPVVSFRIENLGSFFEPSRRGKVYAMSPDRTQRLVRSPDQPAWRYDGPPLEARLGRVVRVKLIHERVTGGVGDGAFTWTADRGLALTGADGQESLVLALPEASEHAAFLPAAGMYRALVDPAAHEIPGATVKELLGYGEWEEPFRVELNVELLSEA
jgi:hypothetical protein